MNNNTSLQKKNNLPFYLIFIFLGIVTLINLMIGVMVLRDPSPLPTSYWDMRWLIIFAGGFLLVGGLALFSRDRWLIIFSLAGFSFLILVPVFTMGMGTAYLILFLLGLIAIGAGEFYLRNLLGEWRKDGLERILFALLIGLGFIMFLVMIQGWLHAFTPLITWLGIGGLSAIFILPNLKRWFLSSKGKLTHVLRSWQSGSNLSGLALTLGFLLILWLPSWLIALSPPMRYDEMTYHLTAPLLYLQRGGIVPYPEGGATVWMHYAEMLFTMAIQTAGLSLPRLLHLMMGLVSALFIFLFGKRLVNQRVGLFAALLFFAVPVVGYEAGTAYIDFFVTAYTTAAGLSILIWWQERNPRWLLVTGVLGGFGLGIKLTAGPIIAIMVALILIGSILRRESRKHYLWVGGMVVLVILLALPWLLRDMFWTGDPFYPYGNMFLQKISASNGVSANTAQVSVMGKSVSRFFTYPFDLVFNSMDYYHEGTNGMASALPLLAFPLFIFLPSLSGFVKKTGLILLAASTIMIWIMLLVNNALIRYALPVFPWLAICAALNVEGVYGWLTEKQDNGKKVVLLAIMLVYLFSTRLPLIVRPFDNLPQRFPLNYFLGRESKETFLSRNLAVYDAFQFIDAQAGTPHRVLSIGNEFRLYTLSRIDGIYDVAEAHNMFANASSPAELAAEMENRGYDYILINQPEVDFRLWKYSDPYPILQNSQFVDTYGELVFVGNGIYVYRFVPMGVQLPPAENLIQNAGFETLGGENDFDEWIEEGAIEASDTAYLGNHSLLLNAPSSPKGNGYVYQRVAVEEGQLYTLGYWINTDQQATFLMQIRWLDDQGNFISTDEDWKNISPGWKWYFLYSQAPKGASFANVFASLGGAENAWVDEICLAEGQRCPAAP